MKRFPYYQQLGIKDCGPACLKMIAAWYGKQYDMNYLRQKCNITKYGVNLLGIIEAAEAIGFRTLGVKIDVAKLRKSMDAGPMIVHWNMDHFVVLHRIRGNTFYIADPAQGLRSLSEQEFTAAWKGSDPKGYALLLEPGQEFYTDKEDGKARKADFKVLLPYFKKYRSYFFQIFFGMAVTSLISLVGPFMTQALVDSGINRQDIGFIYLILGAQLALFLGSTFIEIIRSWILMHIGTRINISMVSDFFKKLMNLPLNFYEQYVVGDLLQRIGDHNRIENLLTINTLSTIFSFVNIIVLSVILFFFNAKIFLVFSVGSILGLLWILMFLKRRRAMDYRFFEVHSKNSNKVLEILTCINDIKISSATRQKRWEWEELQGNLYGVKMKSMVLSQIQNIGSGFINRLVGIIITFISAKAVIDGEITLGSMFAINMIIGQISGPIGQILGFVSVFQDAKIGLERIHDITSKDDEDPPEQTLVTSIGTNQPIVFDNLSFYYGSENMEPVLNDLSFEIEPGKVTAIVGQSGSGKTTLVKLLLKFYQANKGSIHLGSHNFKLLHHGEWRKHCGVVLQDGELLSGTIADNITLGNEKDYDRMIEAARIANIDGFINSLPMNYMAKVGMEGIQVSKGQKQRILLARAVYKNPAYLFLDEATSALDSENERRIIENLNTFFKDRTVVVIAHRLSTVRNADKIIVLDKGRITESGNHQELIAAKGDYYHLVKNQLEISE